ncbi:MAG: 2-oxoisovalerate dehydrogenase, partial [Armatimonadota bacterium]|nr:2-oxoisovalerate dehydrogenase [Armatimonadota bacterium]
EPASVTEHLFSSSRLPCQASNLPQQDTWTMVTAVNEVLRQSLEADHRVMMFGEDIEDPKGGVFGLTKGLSTLFPGRVVNSPLAEATIAGAAVGLAVAGYKPIFEIQFIDFVAPAFNQIVNQIATLRWRSAGAWKCPLVLIAPCGAYLPAGGPWHSLTNEAWFAHTPGIQIVMPSTPQDAAALLRAAIAGDDPVLFLLPKHLFRHKFPLVPEEPIGLGQAAVRSYGSDVTVVAWGNCVELALAAAQTMEAESVGVEVVDLRSLVPCDWSTIRESMAKTGRLVIVQEDARMCSFGQAILTEMTSPPGSWGYLAAPPQLVSRLDVHVPFHPPSEEYILPSAEQVCDAIRLTMRY